MVQIPQYQQQVGLEAPSRDIPNIATPSDGGVGQALSNLGGTISGVAEAVQRRNQQKADFNAKLGYGVLQEDLTQGLEVAKQNAPADGSGLHDNFMKTVFQPKAMAYLNGIQDPVIREQMTAQVTTLLADTYSHHAANAEHEISGKYSETNFGVLRDSEYRGVAANPAEAKKYVDGLNSTIDSLPDVSPGRKAELKAEVAKNVPGIVAEALQVQDPDAYRFFGGTRSPSDKNSLLPSESDRTSFVTNRLTPIVIGLERSGSQQISPAGAVGIMQVVPDAAGVDVARRLGDKAFLAMSPAQRVAFLQNDENNRRYGTAYLGMLVERYHGDAEAALIAYNAGMGNADKWLAAGRDYKALPKAQETMPYVQAGLAQLGAAKAVAGPATVRVERFSGVAAGSGKSIPLVTGTQPGRQPLQMNGVQQQVISSWEQVQGDFGRALPVVSGFRDKATNAKAGGANHSQHIDGNALDIDVSALSQQDRIRLVQLASAHGFTGIGIYKNSIHVDMRAGAPVVWGSDHHAGSVPAWAFHVAAQHRQGAYRSGTPVAGAPASGGQPGGSAMDPGMVFVPPILASMPFADFQTLQAKVADTHAVMADRLKMQQDLLKVQTSSQMADDVASIEQTGKGTVQGADTAQFEQQIITAHGIDRLNQWHEDRFVAQRVYDLTQDAGRLPDQALQARLEALKPQGGDGAAIQKRVYDGVQAKIKSIQEERNKDPALAAIGNFPEVAQAWGAFNPNRPETARDAIRATIAAQQATGVAGNEVQPLPVEQASMVADAVRDETQPLDQRITALVGVVTLTPDPGQQEQIVRQMARAGLTPKIANVIDAWKRNDIGATRRLFQAAMLDGSKAPKLGADDNTLGAAVEDAMIGEGSIGRAFYGLDLGDPRSGDVAASDLDLAKSATRIAMASGMDQEAAVKQAVGDIFGPVDVVDDALVSGGQVRGLVDTGTDKDALLRGFNQAQGKLVDVMQGYLARAYGGLPANASPELQAIYKASHVNEMNRVLADGVWRNNGVGWSFYDPAHQAFVSDDTGAPITFTTDELLKLGAGTPPLPSPKEPAGMTAPSSPSPSDAQPGIATDPWGTGGIPPVAPQGKQGALDLPKVQPSTVAGQLKSQRADMMAAAQVRANMPGVVS